MRKPIGTPHVLWIFEELLRIEIADLPADFAILPGCIERVDRTNAADAVLQIRPKRLKAVANRRDNTHTSDDYSALGHDDIALRLKRAASAGSHADVLHSLEEFSFRPDRRRDDNFSLLELRKIACAYVAHASGDCADEILAAVVNFGRAE